MAHPALLNCAKLPCWDGVGPCGVKVSRASDGAHPTAVPTDGATMRHGDDSHCKADISRPGPLATRQLTASYATLIEQLQDTGSKCPAPPHLPGHDCCKARAQQNTATGSERLTTTVHTPNSTSTSTSNSHSSSSSSNSSSSNSGRQHCQWA